MAKIVCIGDSNTYGFDPRGYFGGTYDRAWPDLLAEKLGWQFINLGENGRTIPCSPRSVALLDHALQAQLPADVILIMLGGNDISGLWDHDAVETDRRMRQYLLHLKEYQTACPKLQLMLISPVEVQVPEESICSAHRMLRGLYQKTAAELGLAYVDAGGWEIPLAFDGIHFTEKGHYVFAAKLEAVLRRQYWRRLADSAGAFVFRKGQGETETLMIGVKGRRYSFPKGHIEPGESPEAAAVREVQEETGITACLLPGFRTEVPSVRPEDHRRIIFFVAEYCAGELRPQQGEISSAFWCPISSAEKLIALPEDRGAFMEALEFYRKQALKP